MLNDELRVFGLIASDPDLANGLDTGTGDGALLSEFGIRNIL